MSADTSINQYLSPAAQAIIEACMITEAVSPDGDPRTVIKSLIQWHLDMDRQEYGRSRVTQVAIKERQVGDRIFNSIRIDVGGLPMYCDLIDGDTGTRQIRAARRIADDNQAFFMYDDINAPRCRDAIGGDDLHDFLASQPKEFQPHKP